MPALSRYSKLKKINIKGRSMFLETQNNIEVKPRDDDILVRWRQTDSTPILANQYLGSPEYYWVILKVNKLAIDSQFKIGQLIRIPRFVSTIETGL
jgi:hypothetical protein